MTHHLRPVTTRCVTPPVDSEITDDDIDRWLDDERNLIFQFPKGTSCPEPDLVSPGGRILLYPDELRKLYRDAIMYALNGKLTERVIEAMREEGT